MDERSYADLRREYDNATRDVDDAIRDISEVLRQIKEWQTHRAASEMGEKVLRSRIDLHRIADFRRLLDRWQQAAHDEWNHYNNAHDTGLAAPRIWTQSN